MLKLPATLGLSRATFAIGSRATRPAIASIPPCSTPPVERPEGELALSFENLIEIALVTALRGSGISLQAIREAHKIAKKEFGEHPFARRDVFIAGKDLFMRASELVEGGSGHLTALTRGGQRAFEPVLNTYLTTIQFERGWPIEWRPRQGAVVQNPEIEFGRPNVDGIRTEVIRERFEADESIGFISDDFGLTPEDVEAALRYEFWLRPAA